jgi:hypothetical protein
MKNRQDEYNQIIKKHFIERFTDRLVACHLLAIADLYMGPLAFDEDSPYKDLTFEKACAELRAWWAEQPRQVWLDMDCGFVYAGKPKGATDTDGNFIEPCWESILVFDAQATKRAVFGVLAEYV